MITTIPAFRQIDESTVDVYLPVGAYAFGQKVGRIALETVTPFTREWRYTPKGSKTGGELFPTLAACKASLMPEYEVTQ